MTKPILAGTQPTHPLTLKDLGWRPPFQAQLTHKEIEHGAQPARVAAVHRDACDLISPEGAQRLPSLFGDGVAPLAVGDWVVLTPSRDRIARPLQSQSRIERKAAGSAQHKQPIAANVDTLLIVTSANQDFNPARLERYLALAHEAQVTPLVIITKADLTDDTDRYAAQARALIRGLQVEAFDARAAVAMRVLEPWLTAGQTLALTGSSGVGKSTLLNTLMGHSIQETQAIRAHDDRGRHTTTARSLHRLPSGAWIVDTPGMRELQLAGAGDGIAQVFEDVAAIVAQCRFSDCQHLSEPGCAIRAALEAGSLTEERLKRYQKLKREDARNTETVAEAHARSRAFGKHAKRIFAQKLKRRDGLENG